MSVEAITWALKQPIKQSSAKFVLTVLANCASGDSWLAYPSVAYLADATGQDRKTILANLVRLRDMGLIEDSGRRMGDTKQVIVYRLLGGDHAQTVPKTEQSQKRNSSENGTVPKTPGKSPVFPFKESRFSAKQSQKRDTEPSEPKGNRQNTHRVCGNELTEADIEREISPLGSLPDWIDHRVLAQFVRHRRVSGRTLSVQGWLQILPQLKSLAASGGDPSQSLRDAMAAGLSLPVIPKSGAPAHGEVQHGSAARVSQLRAEYERRHGGGGAGSPGDEGRAGQGEDVIDAEFAVVR